MPSVVATLQVKSDKVSEAKALFKKLAADTRANESGTLIYLPHQKQEDPTTFVFFEKYEDDAAFALHRENVQSAAAELQSMLAGAPEIVMLEEI